MADDHRLVAVFDCNVYAQAILNRNGPAGALVAAAGRGTFRLAVSDAVLREVDQLRHKFPARSGVRATRVDAFLAELIRFTERVGVVPPVFAFTRDSDDAVYVDLAVATGADYLVTRDKDLLDLSADTPDGRAFAARFPTLRVVDPVAFLSLLPDVQP